MFAGLASRRLAMGGAALALGAASLTANRADGRRVLAEKSEQPWKRLPKPSERSVEKVSQTSFPNAIVREDVDEKLMRLCALSIRCMMGLCFLDRARAYSFGVYLGSSAVEDLVKANGDLASINQVPTGKAGLGPFYPATRYSGSREGYVFKNGPSGLGYYLDAKSAKWTSDRLAAPVMIRLTMLHDVDGEHLAHGFEKTLKSRILPKMKDSKEELEQLTRFKMCLHRLEKIPKGSNFDLIRGETGVLSLVLEGTVLDNFDALLLGWAAVDAFIGPNGHLKPEGKKELVENAKLIFDVKPLTEFS